MSRTHRRIAGAVAAVVAALLLWAFITNPFSDPEPTATDVPDPAATPSATPTPEPTPEPTAPAAQEPGTPSRIMIPKLGVDSAVVPIKTKDRMLDPPADANVIGWWVDGVQPGSAKGSALLTGHSVHDGTGAFIDLENLADGDEIVVRTDNGELHYAVSDVQVLTKDELVMASPELFSQESEGRIVVITCEDWDGTAWQSNVIVTAVPA
ncbi:class F sortase [Nocardioides sp. AE5]|uniref:class F sortase n=1 Tax=Nocardioides sp. AE5 TaxID=2962573 RepID=UPI0028826C1D|nr:class F sortase [Nocardioides sp. AE5]MDT0200581.1 class F sortase [Nocardioides sp. AE5]